MSSNFPKFQPLSTFVVDRTEVNRFNSSDDFCYQAWKSDFPLTSEQETVINAVLRQRVPNLVLRARAGSGKTAILKTIADNTERSILYLVYNTKNKEEARKKMPPNVRVETSHSLAFHGMDVGHKFGAKLGAVMSYGKKYELLDLQAGIAPLRAFRSMQAIESAITTWCQTADPAITPAHFRSLSHLAFLPPWKKGAAAITPDQKKAASEARSQWIAKAIPKAMRWWTLITDPMRREVPLSHDHYLKLYQLSRPFLDYDILMFDEAQDVNGVTLDIVQRQACQKIFIGDSEQQIYGYRGAVNALDLADTGYSLELTRSFRFGDEIADVANQVLRYKSQRIGKALSPVRGNPNRASVIGSVDTDQQYTYITRGNGALFEFALEQLATGAKLHIVGGAKELASMAESVYWLREGSFMDITHPDIKLFQSWAEFEEYAPIDQTMRLVANLVRKHSSRILAMCETLKRHRNTPEKHADVICTTAHRAKGMEWSQVVLGPDFRDPTDPNNPATPEELNILYVAATRALDVLQINNAISRLALALETVREPGDALDNLHEEVA